MSRPKITRNPKRCQRWSKTGGWQMGGTGRWEQCPNDAVLRIHLARGHLGDWRQNQRSCQSCYDQFVKYYHRPHTVLSL